MDTREKNLKTPSAAEKYACAVELYRTTRMTLKEICAETGVGIPGFSSYLSKHHRHLILEKHGLSGHGTAHLRGKKGQTTVSYHKYREAIAACDSMEYIEYSVSQIARIFNLNCTGLNNQLRRHYPEIVPRREERRKQMGITINLQYGARKWSKEQYVKAVSLLEATDMTIREAAENQGVSHSGLREYILAYFPSLTSKRERKRKAAEGQLTKGLRNGNWALHQPGEKTASKYSRALELYRTTSMDIESICRETGVGVGGFRYHLRTWHPDLMVQRRGYKTGTAYSQTKRYRKATEVKYAAAIERLKETDLTTAEVAKEFSLNAETFRVYVKEHFPALTAVRGMKRTENGKLVSARSTEKYAEALHLYETTAEPLRTIAKRLGIVYKSLGGFLRRNHPEAIEKHKLLVQGEMRNQKESLS